MAELSGFPYFEVRVRQAGQAGRRARRSTTRSSRDSAASASPTSSCCRTAGTTTWTRRASSTSDSRRRASALDGPPISPRRKTAVLGILWPSKKFADKEQIPGGAAAASACARGRPHRDSSRAPGRVHGPRRRCKLRKAKALVPRLESAEGAQAEFVELLRAAAGSRKAARGRRRPGGGVGRDVRDRLCRGVPEPRSADHGSPRASHPAPAEPPSRTARAARPATVRLWPRRVRGGRNAPELTTYYEMKERGGTGRQGGVQPMLRRLHRDLPAVRLHLVGHSFGGAARHRGRRGVASAGRPRVTTLTLLQGAFSHNGFARNYQPGKNGAFRDVVSPGMVNGPILVSHTDNDTAVGIGYAIAPGLPDSRRPGSATRTTSSVASAETVRSRPRRPTSARCYRPRGSTRSRRARCTTCWPTTSSPITGMCTSQRSRTRSLSPSPRQVIRASGRAAGGATRLLAVTSGCRARTGPAGFIRSGVGARRRLRRLPDGRGAGR